MEAAKPMTVATKFIAICALLLAAMPGRAQVATPRLTETSFDKTSPFGIVGQKLTYLNADGEPNQPGKAFSEVLPGNGTRAGYVLSHGGVVPSSLRVTVGARSLRPNVDYYLDAANGSLFFMEPVRRLDTVSVFYSYVEGQDGARNPMGMPGLSLNLRGTALKLGFGMSTVNGLDFNTYGLAVNSSLGHGSTLNGLMYFSSLAGNAGNRALRLSSSPDPKQPTATAKDTGTNHLLVQNLKMNAGSATFRATYQDVGAQFNGFQAMRMASANDQATLAQIGMLEREKGVQRLGFGAGMKLGASSNLDIDWNRIGDGKGTILRQALSYQSGALNLRYGTQSVGETFSQFAGLREAEAGQWARERGLHRTDMSLGFTPGKGTQLSFSRNLLGDKTGSLSRQSLSFGTRNLSLLMSDRRAGAGFGRINDLSDAEKTALALDIRRQFNPNATAAEVTAKDKEQLVLDVGLARRQMAASATLGKQSALTYNQFSIDDGKGRVDRRTFGLAGRGFNFSYLDQTIGEGFGRLGQMSDFERGVLANERGIHRTALGLNFALGKASAISFSQLSLGDQAGGMSRQSFAYDARGLNLRVNLADTAKSFARAHDLAGMSDADKQAIEAERGYRRMDFSANLTGFKGLLLNTYVYQARNAAEDLGKSVFRHDLSWTPSKTARVSFLNEGNSFSRAGQVVDGRTHSLLTFDDQLRGGMKFQAFHDTVASTTGGAVQPTVTTDFLHFESDRSKANNLLAETKRIDLGAGKFENTTQLDLNYHASKGLGLHFNRLSIDRGKDPSAFTNTLQWNWQVSKVLNFGGSWADTTTNNKSDCTARSFTLSGMLTKNLNFAGSYSEINLHAQNVKAVSDVSLSNAKPVNLLGLKDAKFTFHYAAVNDQRKQQSEIVAGGVQGMLGKNQIALEYGGALDQKGNSNQSRTLSVISDRSDKLPFHFDLSYRAINVNRGELQLERKYNADFRMNKLTSLTYSYTSLPLNVVNGQAQPITNSAFSLKRVLSRSADLALSYTTAHSPALHTATNKLLAMVNAKTSRCSSVQVGYSVDINRTGGQNTDGHTVQVGFDQKLDADHFVTLTTAYTMYRGAQPSAIQANIDFKNRF